MAVSNPKGRFASVLSVIIWTLLLILIVVRGDWSLYPMLLAILFTILLALSFVRIFQEWKEKGEWLE